MYLIVRQPFQIVLFVKIINVFNAKRDMILIQLVPYALSTVKLIYQVVLNVIKTANVFNAYLIMTSKIKHALLIALKAIQVVFLVILLTLAQVVKLVLFGIMYKINV